MRGTRVGVGWNTLADPPPPADPLQKNDFVAGALLAAPVLQLHQRLGVLSVKPNFGELGQSPRTWKPEREPHSFLRTRQIQMVLCDVAETVVPPSVPVAVGHEHDRNAVVEMLDARPLRTESRERKDRGCIDPGFVGP